MPCESAPGENARTAPTLIGEAMAAAVDEQARSGILAGALPDPVQRAADVHPPSMGQVLHDAPHSSGVNLAHNHRWGKFMISIIE